MCDDLTHCEDCGFCLPISKGDANSICNALPYSGAWQRYRRSVILAMLHALKCHGICAYRTEIVDKARVSCENFYHRDG